MGYQASQRLRLWQSTMIVLPIEILIDKHFIPNLKHGDDLFIFQRGFAKQTLFFDSISMHTANQKQ